MVEVVTLEADFLRSSQLVELKAELKRLIVEAVNLTDVTPESIDDAAPLFGEGLGLDSLDALDLAVALEQQYGVELNLDAAEARASLGSIEALAAFVDARRKT